MYNLPRAITFDCYGTLIDWEGEIQRFFDQLLARRHISHVDARALQRHWEEVQFQYISQAYRSYRQVLRETMKLVCADYQLIRRGRCRGIRGLYGTLAALSRQP